MQRLVVSSGKILIWGEPYDHCGVIRRLAESMLPFDDHWPPVGSIVDPAKPPTPDSWIANAYPHPQHLMAAHRAFLMTLFAEPAREAGFERWGIKGVRMSGDHARYLDRVLGDPVFIFIHRNPYDAYLSYRLLHEIRARSYWWYWTWPNVQVSTPEGFGVMWRELTNSFIANAPALRSVVVSHADVVSGAALDEIETLIATGVDRSVLQQRIGGTRQQRGMRADARTTLTPEEIDALREATGSLAASLGYDGPTEARP
jgi:hypothetical protein